MKLLSNATGRNNRRIEEAIVEEWAHGNIGQTLRYKNTKKDFRIIPGLERQPVAWLFVAACPGYANL